MRSPSVVFGCFIGALAGLAGLNSGCEKLAAGLIAPSPGEFVQALRNRKAEADRKAWKPMRGRALLARNPREAFGRCVGKLDGALQNCLQSASRLENASLLLLEACEQGTSENARPRECTEFAMALSLDEKGLSSCNQAFAAQWTTCVVSRAVRRTALRSARRRFR